MPRIRNVKKDKLIIARPIRIYDETYDLITKLYPDLGFSSAVRKILEDYLRKVKK